MTPSANRPARWSGWTDQMDLTASADQADRAEPFGRRNRRVLPEQGNRTNRREQLDRPDRSYPDHPDQRDGPAERPHRLRAGQVARDRLRFRRRRAILIAVLATATLLIVADLGHSLADTTPRADPPADHAAGAQRAAAGTDLGQPSGAGQPGGGQPGAVADGGGAPGGTEPSAGGAGTPDGAASYPQTGPGSFSYTSGPGRLLGSAGTLHRFRVAVENGTGQDGVEFASAVDTILGDPRSWTAGRQLRLQRVPEASSAEFTIYLATPGTSEKMCASGGLYTDRYTSCRLPGKVIINMARWLGSVPEYGAPLGAYRTYAINHEVGHQLGHGHEACPGPGQLAPVMQQQTLGLKGCVAYGWPYLDGRRYAGTPMP